VDKDTVAEVLRLSGPELHKKHSCHRLSLCSFSGAKEMDAIPIFAQQIFSHLQTSTFQSNDSSDPATPKDFSSLVTFFFSPRALIHWFEILCYGSLLVSLKMSVFHIYKKACDSVFITAIFEETDPTYSKFYFLILSN
jgi:hypothetical protein